MANEDNSDLELRQVLAAETRTEPGDWYLVFKARYGLFKVLETLGEVRGKGTVATQAYTCATAVVPIVQSGMTPCYVDISESTLMIDPEELVVGKNTRAGIIQHTFGISAVAATGSVAARLRAGGALVIEDSAQCAGSLARAENGRPLADVSIHSFGVEKLLPTRFGGAVWLNPEMPDVQLREALRQSLGSLPELSAWTNSLARAYVNENRLLNRLPGRLSRGLRSALGRSHLMEPAIAEEELAGRLPHPAARPAPWMTRGAALALRGLREAVGTRSRAVEVYQRQFRTAAAHSPSSVSEEEPLIWFPLLLESAETAERVARGLTSAGVYVSRWGWPLLFPGVRDAAAFDLPDPERDLPVTWNVAQRVVCLPTNVTASRAREVAGLVAALLERSPRQLGVEFRPLSDEEYRDFLGRQSRVYMTQLVEYGDARAKDGLRVDRVGMLADGEVVGAATVIFEPWKKFFKRANVLYGPSLDYTNPKLVRAFMSLLRRWVREDPQVLSIRVNPYVVRRPYEDTTPGEDLEVATIIDDCMRAVGAKKVEGEFYEDSSVQPRFMYSKDLAGLDYKQVLASTGNNVRSGIRKAAANGVHVEYLGPDDLEVIKPILDHTAERTGMPVVSSYVLERYRRMMRDMGPNRFMFPAAVLDTTMALDSIDQELESISVKLRRLNQTAVEAAASGRELSRKQGNQLRQLETRREALERNRDRTREVRETEGERVVLAASLFLETPTDLIFHHSGGYEHLDHYRGIYAIHGEMLKRATERGLRWYNMNAISGVFEEGGHGYGVFDFKRNFHGTVEEWVGSYDLPIRPHLARALGASQ